MAELYLGSNAAAQRKAYGAELVSQERQTPLGDTGSDFPVERLDQLVQGLKDSQAPEEGWEMGIHIGTLVEGLKEYAVRVQALEEENKQFQERLTHRHEEYLQLRESMRELLDLHELTEAISSSFNIEDILGSLMELSGRFVDYRSCGVFSLDQEGLRLEPMAGRGEEQLLHQRVQAQWDDGIIDWVLRERRPVVIEDIETLARADQREHSFVFIPLLVVGKQIGLYALHCSKGKDEFTFGELELLGVLANQAAVAIENSRLYTELETAHDRLKESQRQLLLADRQAAIGELAGGVAHEVNNPLQIILSRVQLMVIQNKENERILNGLGLIENNVKRISRIIRALLGFARHSAAEGEWGRLELPPLVHQACELVKHQLDTNRIEIEIDCPDDLPPIEGNTGELEQVFINLILNAQNAMPDGGRLQLEARYDQHQDQVELRFIDTGCGIDPEHLDRIFEPFFTTRGESGGTGLGLAVSYGIVEMHKGRLTVESTVDKGTIFTISLPVFKAQEEHNEEVATH
jgi:signal transduction histidine kinase